MKYEQYTLRADCDPHATGGYLAYSAVWPTYRIDERKLAHSSNWSGDWSRARKLGFDAPPSTHAREVLQATAPKQEMQGLRPQWRAAAHMAWTPGPMSVYHRGDCEVTGIDIRGAFLTAMRQPLPIVETWRAVRMRPADILREHRCGRWGLIDATVTVRPTTAPGLTVRDISGNGITPVGTFRGVFPLNVLWYNIAARGVVVEQVHGAQVCDTSPWLIGAADTFSALDPWIRKHMYTRAYGLWGSIGGYRGIRPESVRRGLSYVKIAESSLAWRDEVLRLSSPASPMYRPDVSCCIASHNTVRMLTVMDTLEHRGYKLIASHVDCIWYKKLNGNDHTYCPPDFAEKHNGHGTFIRPGLYVVGDDVGRCGVSPVEAADVIREMPRGEVSGRTWRGLDCIADVATGSAPLYLAPLACERGVWNGSGWLAKKERDLCLSEL
jgi:hypothetical protein